MYHFEFLYDSHGCGQLELIKGCHVEMTYDTRTGSISEKGILVNAIPYGEWVIRTEPEDTAEVGMFIEPGKGWKVRLWQNVGDQDKYEYRGFLIHPDGNKPGTKGCLGLIGTDARPLKDKIDQILKDQGTIPVKISLLLQ